MQLSEIDGGRLFHILNRIAASAAAESYHNLAVAKHCLELFSSAGWMIMMKKREPYYSPRSRWSDHGVFESLLGQRPKCPKRGILAI